MEETSATSFLHLLRDISEAVSREESAIDYDNLLPKIFEETNADSEKIQSQFEAEQLPIPKAEKVFGRDHEKQRLLWKLIDPHEERIQLSVIPIVGGNGIGKTTLARLIYEDKAVKEHFELRAWVNVAGQEFSLQNVATELLKSAIGMSCSLDDLDELDEMVRDSLQSYRCLIVFDEIDSMENDSWMHMEQFWLNVVGFGSKLLITTTSEKVVDLIANQRFELTQLSLHTGWLLCTYLALDGEEDMPIYLALDGEEDMPTATPENLGALCRGIPLLLKLVGSLMRYDSKLRNLISSLDFSDGILVPSSNESVAILLCVWALPPHIRQCLTYCALFPKGCAMKKEKIIGMWIAHGLVKPSPENNSLRSIGDSYFHQLLCRSFFTDITRDQYGDISDFRMPGLIHKITHKLASIVWKGKLGVIGSIGEDAGQLSLVLPLAGEFNSDHMQMLMLSPRIYLGGSLDHSLFEFKDLQSLDLSCSGIRSLPDDICMLKEIGYLNLSYTLIERLPDSITDLSHLHTLDLSCSYHLKVLPKGISNLMHMSHLDLSLCESLSYLPSGIGFLISLTSMPLFVLGKDHDCARLAELRMLNQLKGRLEIRNLENLREISEARDAKLDQKDLHYLGLSWSQNADGCYKLLEHLQPNPHLRVLEITGYMGPGFPWWISSIDSLIKICITDCGCEELPSLGQLPFLKELQLKGMTNIQVIGNEFYGDDNTDVFPSLEQLELYDMPGLLVWSSAGPASGFSGSASRMFHKLKTLTIEGCPQLRILPTLSTLPNLIVLNSNYRIFSSLTSFTSVSSLLVKDMELRISFVGLSRLSSLKKLILFNVNDLDTSYLSMRGLTTLEHLGILHCHQLKDVILHDSKSLQKLHIVDCRNLVRILFVPEITTLTELVVEDCPKVRCSSINIPYLFFPMKLIIRSSDKFITDAEDFKELELDYLSISGCPSLERELEMQPSLISHIPCVMLGNCKANYKVNQDLLESKHNTRLKSIFKDLGRKLPAIDADLFLLRFPPE